MNQLLDAFANLLNQWGWLLILGVVFGGGDALGRVFDGRKKRAILKAENKALDGENKRLTKHMTLVLEKGGDPALITQDMMVTNGRMLDLLSQVQASDEVVPQLPQPLRDKIDRTLESRWPEV